MSSSAVKVNSPDCMPERSTTGRTKTSVQGGANHSRPDWIADGAHQVSGRELDPGDVAVVAYPQIAEPQRP